MKIENKEIMKNLFRNYLSISLFTLIVIVVACKKDDVMTPAKSSDKSMSSFAFSSLSPAVSSTITGTTVAAMVPFNVDVTSLAPTISVAAKATVSPASGSTQNFTNAVTYTVTAEDGTTQAYSVTVTKGIAPKSTAKDITKFSFAALSPAVDATIDATNKTISATVPAGTDATKLVPTITISDKSTISPASGVATDFSKEVSYTVTAEDASTVVWKVNVKKEDIVKSTAKDIIKFSFPTLSPVIDATIDVTTKAINATVPIGTDLTKLVPTISISDKATISPAKGVAQDFSKEVSYTVTAEDASTVVYKVNIKSGFPTNDLVAYFPFNGSAKDESGKGIDGKVNGAVLAKDRKGNQNCYSFDGKSNITFDKIPGIGIDNWAISFWTNNTIDKQLAMFISLGNEDGTNANGFSIGYGDGLDNTGYKLQGVFGGVALVPWNISGQNDAGAWRHFVMQRQNGVTKFYFAGKLLFTSNVLSNPKQPTSFTIGSGSSGSKLPRNYNGSLDDIRIYNKALNDQEIMALSLE